MPPLVRCHSLFHPKKTNTFGVSINVHGLCNWWVRLYVGIAISSAELWFRFTKDLAFVEFPRARLTCSDSTNNQQIMPSVNITFVSKTSWGLKLNESSSSSPGKYNIILCPRYVKSTHFSAHIVAFLILCSECIKRLMLHASTIRSEWEREWAKKKTRVKGTKVTEDGEWYNKSSSILKNLRPSEASLRPSLAFN